MGDKPEKPSGAVDDCTEPIPDTASEVKKTRARFGKETYKKELGPGRKQGRWTNDARNRRVALGNILPLYKVVLGVGCEKIEGKEQWGVGLIHLDVQFRIVLGPGLKTSPGIFGIFSMKCRRSAFRQRRKLRLSARNGNPNWRIG